MSHPYLDAWLRGTTCQKRHIKREVLFENDTHIVLKHHSHAEYCGRAYGTQTCGAYAKLYEKKAFEDQCRDFLYAGMFTACLKEWKGRINLKRVREDCKTLGVEFP